MAGLSWLRGILVSSTDFLEHFADAHAADDFCKRVEEKVSAPVDDDAQPVIDDIARALKIEPKSAGAAEEVELMQTDGTEVASDGEQESS